jgi:hypothetical protein
MQHERPKGLKYSTTESNQIVQSARLMNTDGTGFYTCIESHKTKSFESIPLQTARKENNWKTQEALSRAAVTVETELIKGSNP